jgi:hypothetical protein
MGINIVNDFTKDFTCDKCNEAFYKGWSDEEAMKEFEEAPWNVPDDEIGVICDDCFKEFQIWFNSLKEEDHNRIRNNE